MFRIWNPAICSRAIVDLSSRIRNSGGSTASAVSALVLAQQCYGSEHEVQTKYDLL